MTVVGLGGGTPAFWPHAAIASRMKLVATIALTMCASRRYHYDDAETALVAELWKPEKCCDIRPLIGCLFHCG